MQKYSEHLAKLFIALCSCCTLFSLVLVGRENTNIYYVATNASQPVFEIPDIFKNYSIYRKQNWSSVKGEELWKFQASWSSSLRRSEYMKSVKRKKRILVTGLFNLDKKERKLPCYEEGVDFSDYCELKEDYWFDPRYPNYDEYDAVLIRRDWNYQFYEPKIPPGKPSVFHIQESPYTFFQGDFRVNNPLLASYWRGSDIFSPYYKWLTHNKSNIPSTSKEQMKTSIAQNKTKFAAMLVSHCPTENKRLEVAQELQKYVPVDIFGDCGTLSCPGYCQSEIGRDYKFYLAFENANCRDYITEKFFINGLGQNIIPVVLGAHPDDYKDAAPPHSYISVDDFPSLKHLADYLKLLDSRNDLYDQYFQWKSLGHIVHGSVDLFCRVCAFLHYADFYPVPTWPKTAYSWYNVNPCLPPGKNRWN